MKAGGSEKQIVVGITGASGAAYARRLVECLCDGGTIVHLVVSPNGERLLSEELGVKEVSAAALLGRDCEQVVIHPYGDVGAPLASGSFETDGMIVCPCSSNSLAAIATGLGENLLHRAAAVTLKEMRRLIVVPREMPMNRIDLLNALRLSEMGAVVCPASPGFYMMPKTVGDLVDFVVGKLLNLFEVPHRLNTSWADQLEANRTRRRATSEE
jgi:4-hydroxy-3-polyprenylbenzoate decarboxylase